MRSNIPSNSIIYALSSAPRTTSEGVNMLYRCEFTAPYDPGANELFSHITSFLMGGLSLSLLLSLSLGNHLEWGEIVG